MRHNRSRRVSLSVLGLAFAGLGLDQLGLLPSGAGAEPESVPVAVQAPSASPRTPERVIARLGSPRVELANRLKAAKQAQPALDVIFASDSHDPFVAAPARAQPGDAEAEPVTPASMWAPRLTTVIATGNVRSAIIDGVTCTQGQEVAGVGRIVEIKRDSVVIEHEGETRELFVRPSGA